MKSQRQSNRFNPMVYWQDQWIWNQWTRDQCKKQQSVANVLQTGRSSRLWRFSPSSENLAKGPYWTKSTYGVFLFLTRSQIRMFNICVSVNYCMNDWPAEIIHAVDVPCCPTGLLHVSISWWHNANNVCWKRTNSVWYRWLGFDRCCIKVYNLRTASVTVG